jgi:hypothetical protein
MALTLSESAKQERKLPEAGATVGMLYSLVDLGTQETNWDGEKKYTPKVRLTFELPDQTDEFEVEENGKAHQGVKADGGIHRADPLAWREGQLTQTA